MQQDVDIFIEILKNIYSVSDVDKVVKEVLRNLLFCPFCSEYFANPSVLSKHIKGAHQDKLVCNTIRVKKHEVGKGAETIYICPHCYFAVDDNCSSPTSSIISHVENHTISIDPSASISFQITQDKRLIQTYIKGTAENKVFRCPVCKDILGDSKELLRHLCFKHSDAASKNIPDKTIMLIKDCVGKHLVSKKTKVKHKLKYTF